MCDTVKEENWTSSYQAALGKNLKKKIDIRAKCLGCAPSDCLLAKGVCMHIKRHHFYKSSKNQTEWKSKQCLGCFAGGEIIGLL